MILNLSLCTGTPYSEKLKSNAAPVKFWIYFTIQLHISHDVLQFVLQSCEICIVKYHQNFFEFFELLLTHVDTCLLDII